MRFLLDENLGKVIAQFLRQLGYSVSRIRNVNPGIDDNRVLNLSLSMKAILLTSDKDFGELIFKKKRAHFGVIFFRLKNESSVNKIKALVHVLRRYQRIENYFTVITEKEGKFKIRRSKRLLVLPNSL